MKNTPIHICRYMRWLTPCIQLGREVSEFLCAGPRHSQLQATDCRQLQGVLQSGHTVNHHLKVGSIQCRFSFSLGSI